MAQASATLLQYPFQQRQLPLQFHLQRGVRLPGDFIPKTTLLASKVRLRLVGPAGCSQSRKGSWGESSDCGRTVASWLPIACGSGFCQSEGFGIAG